MQVQAYGMHHARLPSSQPSLCSSNRWKSQGKNHNIGPPACMKLIKIIAYSRHWNWQRQLGYVSFVARRWRDSANTWTAMSQINIPMVSVTLIQTIYEVWKLTQKNSYRSWSGPFPSSSYLGASQLPLWGRRYSKGMDVERALRLDPYPAIAWIIHPCRMERTIPAMLRVRFNCLKRYNFMS